MPSSKSSTPIKSSSSSSSPSKNVQLTTITTTTPSSRRKNNNGTTTSSSRTTTPPVKKNDVIESTTTTIVASTPERRRTRSESVASDGSNHSIQSESSNNSQRSSSRLANKKKNLLPPRSSRLPAVHETKDDNHDTTVLLNGKVGGGDGLGSKTFESSPQRMIVNDDNKKKRNTTPRTTSKKSRIIQEEEEDTTMDEEKKKKNDQQDNGIPSTLPNEPMNHIVKPPSFESSPQRIIVKDDNKKKRNTTPRTTSKKSRIIQEEEDTTMDEEKQKKKKNDQQDNGIPSTLHKEPMNNIVKPPSSKDFFVTLDTSTSSHGSSRMKTTPTKKVEPLFEKETNLRSSLCKNNNELDATAAVAVASDDDDDDTDHDSVVSLSKPPTLGVVAHRLRPPTNQSLFYQPSTIVCMAASSSSSIDQYHHNGLIAISHENGLIECKSVHQKLRTIGIVPGLRNHQQTITCMTWIHTTTSATNESLAQDVVQQQQPILLGGTESGFICIIDFTTCTLRHLTPSGGGGVFSIVQCGINQVAIGCEDGIVRIVDVSSVLLLNKETTRVQDNSNQLLDIVSSLPSAGASILSLACSKHYNQFRTIFAGVADGTIRRYDNHSTTTTSSSSSSNPHFYWKSSLRMTTECFGVSIPTRIWCLRLLRDGILISGDSLGHIQIWNGMNGTLDQSFDQNDMRADVLTLDVSYHENKIFASGINPRVICIERNLLSKGKRWVLTSAHNMHSHDVKALCVVPYYDEKKTNNNNNNNGNNNMDDAHFKEMLLSGGVDTKFCVYSVNEFPRVRPKIIFPLPTQTSSPYISIALQARYMAVCYPNNHNNHENSDSNNNNNNNNHHTTTRVDVRQLARKAEKPGSTSSRTKKPMNHKSNEKENDIICTLQIDSGLLCNLLSTCISDDGRFLVLTDAHNILLFHFDKVQENDDNTSEIIYEEYATIIPMKVDISKDVRQALRGSYITTVSFLQNDKIILATASPNGDQKIHILSIRHNNNTESSTSTTTTKKFVTKLIQTIVENPFTIDLSQTTETKMTGQRSVMILPIHTISSTPDGQWFYTTRHTSHTGSSSSSSSSSSTSNLVQVQMYCCQTNKGDSEVLYKHYWSLPHIKDVVSAISFVPPKITKKDIVGSQQISKKNKVSIIVATLNFSVYMFDVVNRTLSRWNEQAGYPIKTIPMELENYRYEYPLRIGMNPATPHKILLGTFGSLISINMKQEYPRNYRFWPENHVRGFDNRKKRKRSYSNTSETEYQQQQYKSMGTIFFKYNNMLHMDFLDSNEIVVVEQPWLNVLHTLPDALEQKIYGT